MKEDKIYRTCGKHVANNKFAKFYLKKFEKWEILEGYR
jgi:hypothetical protein